VGDKDTEELEAF